MGVRKREERKNPLDLKYDAWFNPTTDCSIIDECYKKALTKFSIIFASKEISVYKILNHFHEEFNLTDSNIKTVDGLALESYFDINYKHAYNMNQMQHLLSEGILQDITNKWLVIPNMTQPWNSKLAFFFYNEIKSSGCLGIIFNSTGPNNLGQILVEQTVLKVVQFPDQIYNQTNYIEDDGY